MIGWTSRNTGNRRRRSEWWASLTEEEKALVRRREAVADRWFFYTLGAVVGYLITLGFAVPEEWYNSHRGAVIGLWLLGHPGSLVIGAFVAGYKKRRVK